MWPPAGTWPGVGLNRRGIMMKRSIWNVAATVLGVGGLVAAISATTPAFGVAGNTASGSAVKILVATHPTTQILTNADIKIVSLKVPRGKWLLSAKLWADSQPAKSTIGTVVGCSLWKGTSFLDNSAFNTPKAGGAFGTSAGVEALSAVVTLHGTATIIVRCDDFGSMARSHQAVLTAIGG
jgi:hypothetical protein